MNFRYINCHTHIFNVKCAPDRFIGLPVARLLASNRTALGAVHGLMRVGEVLPFLKTGTRESIEKMRSFLKIGTNRSQEGVFELLRSNYSFGPISYVALTLNMDHMGAGKALIPFSTQLSQVADLKIIYKEDLIPFVSIDPRSGSPDQLLQLVQDCIEKKAFGGIKMYPPLGFYPFDPRLEKVYAYAQEYGIPILTHVSKGGIFYQGDHIPLDFLEPISFGGHRARWTSVEGVEGAVMDFSKNVRDTRRFLGKTWGKGRRNEEFKVHFSDPRNYHVVLKKFPRLKLCMAHFGGDESISEFIDQQKAGTPDPLNWHHIICEILRSYPQTYADVSYALWKPKVWPRMSECIDPPKGLQRDISDRILFGTDYYMTIQEESEVNLVNNFRKAIGNERFKKIAVDNARQYLEHRAPLISGTIH